MSLALSLNNALSGLNINQQALGTLSHNIANANTQGYSRQVLNQTARVVGGIGSGVSLEGITRKVDFYLDKAAQEQATDVARLEVINDFSERIQILLGQPGATNSLDEYIEDFFNTLQNLAETPDRASFQAQAVNEAGRLAREFSNLALGLEDLRYQADQDIANSTTRINQLIEQLHGINMSLTRSGAVGSGTASLLDERDIALDELSELMNVKLQYLQNGEVRITTGNGVGLLEERPSELVYNRAAGVDNFINGEDLGPLLVYQLDNDGQRVGNPLELVSGGAGENISTVLTGGRIKGNLEIRDIIIPDSLAQLDSLASALRDGVNALHNNGSGFPGASSLTGTRPVLANEWFDWAGTVQIAVLNEDGTPVASEYSNDPFGLRPLNLDLGNLDDGLGAGKPSNQAIIDEINNYFGPQQSHLSLGPLNNIELAAISDKIPGSPPQFEFDLALENISGQTGDLFVRGVTVLDDGGNDITNTSNSLPAIELNDVGTFTTFAGDNRVRVNLGEAHNLQAGDRVYLPDPGGMVDGIPASELSGFFIISNVNSGSFDITVDTDAVGGGNQNVAGLSALTTYASVGPNEAVRTGPDGTITASLSGNDASTFYTIAVEVSVFDEEGNESVSTIQYQVSNNQQSMRNERYPASSASDDAQLIAPENSSPFLEAILVDENGVELPIIDGAYVEDVEGFLQINALRPGTVIAFNEGDSSQLGRTSGNNRIPATERGFSHFFELNNFFESNIPSDTGDTLEGSAYYMQLEERIARNPSQISTGYLTAVGQSVDPDARPNYTFERLAGDNRGAQALADLNSQINGFAAAGGLPNVQMTFGGYMAEIISFTSATAIGSELAFRDADTLLQGFRERSESISGVNLDEELANTIIYQNAYTASARVLSVTDELYDTLLSII